MAKQSVQITSRASNPWWHRIVLVCCMVLYVACFEWMYVHYLYPVWDYFGFHYEPPSFEYLLLVRTLSVLPALWMPIQLQRPSQLAYWVLYVMVLIPSLFVPFFAGLNPAAEISGLALTLFVGFAIIGSSYLLPLLPLHRFKLPRGVFWFFFALVVFGLTAWMVLVFRHNLHIVSFADVYDLRNDSSDIAEGTLVNYAYMALTGAINPFLMGCGLYYRRAWLFASGAFGQLLVYSVLGTKGAILSILFVPGMYFLLRGRRIPFGLKLTLGISALLVGLCVSYSNSGANPGPLQTVILFVVLMRTFSGAGLTTAWYYDFFQRNPITYFSHIHGVNLFVHYPYVNVLGIEVGSAYSGDATLDASAHLWATDGLGALGVPGILVISALCALVFWVLDSASRGHDVRFVALATTYAAYNLANISIFTSLFSGGLALLILTLYLMPRQTGRGFESKKWKEARAFPALPGGRQVPVSG
jgi:hypothetical protein